SRTSSWMKREARGRNSHTSNRHPEVAAKRPSKDAGRGAGAVALRGSLRSHLRVTEQLRMNTGRGIVLKLVSAVLFAVMSALIRYLGARYPIGGVVFSRWAFAIVPVVRVYAWRGELMAAVRTDRPLGHANRGMLSVVGMFCNFGALARLPLIEANAISFASPLISVAFAAVFLKERVRIYRWSAVTIGFLGVLVVLAPHFSGDELTIAMASATSVAGVLYAVAGDVANAGTMIQTRHLTKSETTSSIVFYFSLICA